ncbi:MAG: DivIVA domain-containing protein [Candidatus Zixiibacteriota bacterium]
MELSPNDIRNFEFGSQMRGYDKEAVDSFKEQVALSLEMLKQENLKLTMETESLKVQLAGLKQFEDAIKNAAIDARRNADITMANARKEAELLLNKVASEASQVLANRTQRRDELEAEISRIELTRRSYLSKLRALITAHLEWVDELAKTEVGTTSPAPSRVHSSPEDDIEITQTSEINARRRETIATQPSQSQRIHTEDANAAQRIVSVTPDSGIEDVAALKSAIQDQPQAQPSVDPELAAALENYKRLAEARAKADPSSTGPILRPAPKFVTSNGATVTPELLSQQIKGEDVSETTDKVRTSQQTTPETTRAKLDGTPTSPGHGGDLADVLDNVVHKFEEEMDKAAKS